MTVKRIYKVRRSSLGKRMRYLDHTGKLYTELWAALARAKTIENEGAKATVFYADVEWKELEVSDGHLPGAPGTGD